MQLKTRTEAGVRKLDSIVSDIFQAVDEWLREHPNCTAVAIEICDDFDDGLEFIIQAMLQANMDWRQPVQFTEPRIFKHALLAPGSDGPMRAEPVTHIHAQWRWRSVEPVATRPYPPVA